MAVSRAVIFDGDDTLWETEALYDVARDLAAEIVESAGFSSIEFQRLQREIDISNVRTMSFSSSRFPTSSVQAYDQLAKQSGARPAKAIRSAIYEASASVFEMPAPLFDGVESVLREVRNDFQIGLLTKGDADVQARRISQSGLKDLFAGASIVDEKSESEFIQLLNDLECLPSASWSVGNSLGSDVLPALSIGMSAIWIDAPVWGHERSLADSAPQNPRLYVAQSIKEVPAILNRVRTSRLP